MPTPAWLRPSRDWRAVLRHAWSVRFMLLAAFLSAIEAVLPLLVDHFPKGVFATLTFAVVGAALIARFVAQPKTLPGDADE